MSRRAADSAADFTQAIGLLIRRLRSAAAAPELSQTEFAVIKRLDLDGPATTADLARAESMRPQSTGAVVGALEEARLVERRPHPTDGRQVNIVITPKGVAARANAKDAISAWLADAIAKLEEDERETLFAAGRIINRLVEK